MKVLHERLVIMAFNGIGTHYREIPRDEGEAAGIYNAIMPAYYEEHAIPTVHTYTTSDPPLVDILYL